ncbi:MAG TPA: glucokinase [Terriglobia bacterium]|jgi:glucokinase
MILAGDIGGTKCALALFLPDNLRTAAAGQTFRSKDFAGLEDVIREFLSTAGSGGASLAAGQITHACFGIAGPIINESVQTPNLPWTITAAGLRTVSGTSNVQLINDLEATAHGVFLLRPDEFITLNEGAPPPHGDAALIAAGTGLGEAILHWGGATYTPVASEGGHADFAPRNEIEIELLRHLIKRFGHVSYERVLSGPGLFNIYSFLRDAGYGTEEPWLTDKLKQSDPSAAVSQAALAGESELCVRALEMFVAIYGAEAGNLALKAMAVAGIYVGGGIAPKIIEKLRSGTFMRAFTDKSRLSALLEKVPVRVITNPSTALYGAARAATLTLR